MIDFDVFDTRDLFIRGKESYPAGENATDTVIAGVHLNATALDMANYTFYPSNNTLSNGSDCYLAFTPLQPAFVHPNASFVNATSCYSSIYSIGPRGFAGIGIGVVYALAIVLSLVCLTKHGALYLPVTRRFFPIGRRWQWYWACFVSACALTSLFSNVDIERYFLQDLPIVLTVFFWYLMCVGTMAVVWEAVRHWGSWLERQYIDPNPFIYREDDRRAKIEFWLPMWFYFWVWMVSWAHPRPLNSWPGFSLTPESRISFWSCLGIGILPDLRAMQNKSKMMPCRMLPALASKLVLSVWSSRGPRYSFLCAIPSTTTSHVTAASSTRLLAFLEPCRFDLFSSWCYLLP